MKKIVNFLKTILNIVLYYLIKIVPKKKKRWIFGSWFGNNFSDNTKWLYLYILNRKLDVEVIWIIKNKSDMEYINDIGGRAYLYNSIKSIYYLITADVVFMTQGFIDFSDYYLIGGSYKVQLWHGVAMKRIGYDYLNLSNMLRKINFMLQKKLSTYDLYIAPSEEYSHKLMHAYLLKEKSILYVGQPRNDIMFNGNLYQTNNELKKIIKGKKVITYMPTFRDKDSELFNFNKLQGKELNNLLCILKKQNAIILEKSHFVDINFRDKKFCNIDQYIINISDVDTQELLINTDILITDYSSCYFDFLLLNRPIIHYVYDYNYYKNKDRGLYYNIEDVAGGDVCKTVNELLTSIGKYLEDPSLDGNLREEMKDKFSTFEDGRSCEKIVNCVLKKYKTGENIEKSNYLWNI